LTTFRVESRQCAATTPAFNLPHLHLATMLGGDPAWVLLRFLASENFEFPGYCLALFVWSYV